MNEGGVLSYLFTNKSSWWEGTHKCLFFLKRRPIKLSLWLYKTGFRIHLAISPLKWVFFVWGDDRYGALDIIYLFVGVISFILMCYAKWRSYKAMQFSCWIWYKVVIWILFWCNCYLHYYNGHLWLVWCGDNVCRNLWVTLIGKILVISCRTMLKHFGLHDPNCLILGSYVIRPLNQNSRISP